ncbi:MAG TPA: hypothetical protein VKA68_07795 [bacterium]|nr:hypothetical protein [bacterium]
MCCISVIVLVFVSLSVACGGDDGQTLKPSGLEPQTAVTLRTGDITAVFVDNSAFGPHHRAGYNGIAELYHTEQDSSLFVPAYAGYNIEHYFGGDSLQELFEPRRHPMELYRSGDQEVLLYQPPTPVSGVESLTRFVLEPPHYIDVTFRCVFHSEDIFQHGYAGIFWASYINAPADRHIYFPGHPEGDEEETWIRAFSEKHGVRSTHRWEQDDSPLFFAENFNVVLASHFSEYRFTRPFYFGRFHNMAYALLFDSRERIRFSQSPTGGGDRNPAWDFQLIVRDYQLENIYSYHARIVYKPFISREDIRREYEVWKAAEE